MLTDQDIQKIVDAQKDVFPSRIEFTEFKEEMTKQFSDLLSAIDGYAKKADTYFEEMVALSHKVDRHEKWLLQLAEKLGVKLEY
jgi:uncharacterized coiled-coil DUF342 family protein